LLALFLSLLDKQSSQFLGFAQLNKGQHNSTAQDQEAQAQRSSQELVAHVKQHTLYTAMLSFILIPYSIHIRIGMDDATASSVNDSTSSEDTSNESNESSNNANTNTNNNSIDSTPMTTATMTTIATIPVEVVQHASEPIETHSELALDLPTPSSKLPSSGKRQPVPSTDYYSSNHVLVNRERVRRNVEPLQRCRYLDDLASFHAQEMAERLEVFHSGGLDECQSRLKSRWVGENVQCGTDIRSMHHISMNMRGHSNRTNLLSRYLNQFGMGTAKGADGLLYMAQLFRHAEDVDDDE
jgi:uncharacterized protein YkwD